MKASAMLIGHAAVLAVLVLATGVDLARGRPGDRTGVVWIDVRRGDMTGVRYESPAVSVSLTPSQDAWGEYVRVDVVRRKAMVAPSNPHELPRGGPGDLEDLPAPVEAHFTGGAIANQAIERLAPFVVLRAMDDVDADRLAEFGLAEPTGTLELELKSGTRTFAVGSRAPGGGGGHYLRDASDGRVLLVEGSYLAAFEAADKRMIATQLADLPLSRAVAAELTVGGASVRVEQRDADDPSKAQWLRQGEVDEAAASWIGRMMSLRGVGFVATQQIPASVVVRARLTLVFDDGRALPIELLEVPDAPPEDRWLGRSPAVRGALRLPAAMVGELATDAAGVVGG